jgi:riboflavin kinase/FMN adenylyltransferase
LTPSWSPVVELIRGPHNLRSRHRGCAATIGNFDGLHLGHQAVIRGLLERARILGVPALVMCFEPTPREYFAPGQAPPRLTRFREKAELLACLDVDRFLCVPFNARVADTPPGVFIDELLVGALGIRHLVVGDDFRFGRNRDGDFALLAEAGRRHGFEVLSTPSFTVDGARVSSTRIREALAAGDLAAAERLLGRSYSMSGRVVEGARLGRALGYPTANLKLGRRVSPLDGIFAVRVNGVDTAPWPGVASLGTRPTVDGGEMLLEAHLFDFDGNLYGRHLNVEFVARLREERRFDSLDALTEQMHEDAAQARSVLDLSQGSP